jgi:hypothetical protein
MARKRRNDRTRGAAAAHPYKEIFVSLGLFPVAEAEQLWRRAFHTMRCRVAARKRAAL